jgi:predicted alpha/beta superfamily hydrolase
MGSTYQIYVRYPEGYRAHPATKYPVVYLLDGDSAFPLLTPEHLFLSYDDHVPDAIIVGIAYGLFEPPVNHREVDFGPRAADFERFLADELLPIVERRTHADPARRILVGQSYGGTFVLHSAFTRPDLFWALIASNPSPRLDQATLSAMPPRGDRTDHHLFIVSGTQNSPASRQAALEWARRWGAARTPWSVEEIDIPGGTHAADLPNAYRAALRRLFQWKP